MWASCQCGQVSSARPLRLPSELFFSSSRIPPELPRLVGPLWAPGCLARVSYVSSFPLFSWGSRLSLLSRLPPTRFLLPLPPAAASLSPLGKRANRILCRGASRHRGVGVVCRRRRLDSSLGLAGAAFPCARPASSPFDHRIPTRGATRAERPETNSISSLRRGSHGDPPGSDGPPHDLVRWVTPLKKTKTKFPKLSNAKCQSPPLQARQGDPIAPTSSSRSWVLVADSAPSLGAKWFLMAQTHRTPDTGSSTRPGCPQARLSLRRCVVAAASKGTARRHSRTGDDSHSANLSRRGEQGIWAPTRFSEPGTGHVPKTSTSGRDREPHAIAIARVTRPV